ncbi:MAG: hypothetical protein ACOCN7_07160, partial [Prevotella sp.]
MAMGYSAQIISWMIVRKIKSDHHAAVLEIILYLCTNKLSRQNDSIPYYLSFSSASFCFQSKLGPAGRAQLWH